MAGTPPRGPLLPPVYVLAALMLMGALHLFLPLREFASPALRYAGIVVLALGLGLGGWAVVLFHRAKTGIVPFTPATFLVADGPYRHTRNPMYVGMAGVLIGAALFLGSITPFIVIPAFIALIDRRFILAEEAMLKEAFGTPYLDYKAKVRRWL